MKPPYLMNKNYRFSAHGPLNQSSEKMLLSFHGEDRFALRLPRGSMQMNRSGVCHFVFFLQHQVVWGSVVLIPDIHRSLWLFPLPGPWILTVAKIKPLIWQVTFLWFWLQTSLSWSASSSNPFPTMFRIPPVSPSENLPAWGELNMMSGRVWQWDVFDRFQIFSTWRTIPRIVSG